MSEDLVIPRELLERLSTMELDTTPRSIRLQDELRALLSEQPQAIAAQSAPAGEREAVEVVGWRHSATGSVTEDAVRASTWISECAFPLMTVAQHERILSAVTAERDRLRKDAERLDRLDIECEGYGCEGVHEGNRWMIDGPFRTVRDAIDAALAAKEG